MKVSNIANMGMGILSSWLSIYLTMVHEGMNFKYVVICLCNIIVCSISSTIFFRNLEQVRTSEEKR